MKHLSRWIAVILVAALLLGTASVLIAQAKESETDLYTAWYNEKDTAKKVDVAKKYLEKFPNGQYAAYMKQSIMDYKFQRFAGAFQSHNAADVFGLAKELLNDHIEGVEHITLLYWPALESRRLTLARDFTLEKEGREFTQQAITEIEAGKVPAVVQDKADWERNIKNKALAMFYQNLGLMDVRAKASEQAVTELKKALSLDSNQPYSAFQLGLLFQNKYDEDLKKYNGIADKESAEAKSLLEILHQDADDAIDAFGRFMALTEGNAQWANQRNSVDSVLKEYWKTRHPDDPNGAQKAVDKYKTPSTSATGN